MEQIYYSKIVKDTVSQNAEKKTLLFIKSKWSEMALELIIHASDTNETFKGELVTAQINRIAEELDSPLENFYDECKIAITTNMGAPGYLYRLDSETFRIIKKEPFEVELLEVPLRILSSPLQIIENAFQQIEVLKEKSNLKASQDQHEEVSAQETMDALQTCLKEKEQTEKMLMRKFLMILNSKKEEIIRLKDQLEGRHEHVETNNDDDFDADTQPMDEIDD